MTNVPTPRAELTADERRLAELGYKQELHRSWSGFSNFAISFSIISILAGCFTTFAVGWNNGGPMAIFWGWSPAFARGCRSTAIGCIAAACPWCT